ncbi:Tetratricopeptide repeat protein [Pseudooctadecabacter jejudonensis]|uniref:Tetratricopeptide repeat protein n=1 Tax=Pseudooctadecabacter jejudonensis TaxID=1391910 RepID=A0A1Y5RRG6_9RHOB|nr:Tetratricopeptide repeat protein [Pseudooctadecabacter jejudonensis]
MGPDFAPQIDALVAQLQVAPDEQAARGLAAQMWEIWLDAPDALAQSMLDEGMALLRMGDMGASRAALTELIAYCGAYAEGYNQRAFAAFLSGDYEAALVDLDRAIDLRPQHLGALTGKALTLIEMGRGDEAQEVLRRALDINPWLAERALLEGPLERDI